MAIEPHPYQAEGGECLIEARRDGKTRALVVMAPGLGKTVLAALDAKNWLEKYGGRLLYLCHQTDILVQAKTTFEFVLGRSYTYGYFHGGEKHHRPVTCLFASFQTMRLAKWQRRFSREEFDYIVVDESHHGPAPTYRPVLGYFQPKFLLGITATPDRTDLQDIREIYGEEIYSLPLEDALAQGLLTPVAYYLVTDELQNLAVLDTPIGKLSVKYINKKLFVPRRDEEIARIIKKYMAEIATPRVMIFCPSVAYCERLTVYFPYAFPIHSRIQDREQRARLDAFRNGLANVVLTVDKFNEGIDIPDANVIVFLRSTTSRMVFFHQLGRGLRKFPGKKRVVVLDFVANCERLQMVHDLWKEVGEKHGEYEVHEKTPAVSVDIGAVQFTEVAKRVLDVIAAIRGGYTREMLIRELRILAEKLGKTPGYRDIESASKAGEGANHTTFLRHFGSIRAALEAAGFTVTGKWSRRTKAEILDQLKRFAKELGRTPTSRDFDIGSKAGKVPSLTVFQRYFGTRNAAIRAARLPLVHRVDYTREELLQYVRKFAVKLGRAPMMEDIDAASKAGRGPSSTTLQRHFGSYSASIKAAGLPPHKRYQYSRLDLIRQLQEMSQDRGRRPTKADILAAWRAGRGAPLKAFLRIFRSLQIAIRAAGS